MMNVILCCSCIQWRKLLDENDDEMQFRNFSLVWGGWLYFTSRFSVDYQLVKLTTFNDSPENVIMPLASLNDVGQHKLALELDVFHQYCLRLPNTIEVGLEEEAKTSELLGNKLL